MFDGGYMLPPEIVTDTIDFEITGVGSEMRGFDNFPSITMFVKVKTLAGELITDLQEPDFFEAVDDDGEARPIYVTPRGAVTSTNKKADIVFVIDTTGSMYSYLDTMTAKAQDFADVIAASDIDYRLGYVTFGDDIRKGANERLAPTSNVDTFKAAVDALTAYGGADGLENQIDCIDYARAGADENTNPAGSFQKDMSFSYRNDAARIFILITDIGYHYPGETSSDVLGYYPGGVENTDDEEIELLNDTGILLFVVGPSGVGYEELAEGTGGAYYNTDDAFADIIDTIGEEITLFGDYMITFLTSDFMAGKLHTIRLAVHTRVGDAQDTVTFTAPAVVDYERAAKMLKEDNAKHIKK